jgi:hypothetical protein
VPSQQPLHTRVSAEGSSQDEGGPSSAPAFLPGPAEPHYQEDLREWRRNVSTTHIALIFQTTRYRSIGAPELVCDQLIEHFEDINLGHVVDGGLTIWMHLVSFVKMFISDNFCRDRVLELLRISINKFRQLTGPIKRLAHENHPGETFMCDFLGFIFVYLNRNPLFFIGQCTLP